MNLLTSIAVAILLGHVAASPGSVTAIVTIIETSRIPTATGPSAIPSNMPIDMILPAVTPVNHGIHTETRWGQIYITTTTAPVTCELIPCTTTAFWYYSPITTKPCQSKNTFLYCDDFKTVSTTCLDQNHLPDCLYYTTYFPLVSETTVGWFWLTPKPIYGTTSKCVPPDPQRAAFAHGELSCHSFCKYTSMKVERWPWETFTRTSTTTTCVESLSSCLYTTEIYDTVDWLTGPRTVVYIPPATPTSGGCSWFTFRREPDLIRETTWPITSTCLYPDAMPSCLYTYDGKCVPLEEAATKGQPTSQPASTTTSDIPTTEITSSAMLSAVPAGRGEGGCSWRIPESDLNRRECWIKDTEVDEWVPATRSSNGCSWFTSFTTKIDGGKTTISLASTCKPTPTVTWSLTTLLTETMVTFGSTSSSLATTTMTRPVTSGNPSATASAGRGDSQIHIDLDSSILDEGLKEANNLCAHREPIDGRRLNCELMPQWAMLEFEEVMKERLINRVNDNAVEFSQHGHMDQWIYENATLRNEFIILGAGRQMTYNITHGLALEESFALEPDVMIEINEEMREEYPEELEDDDEDSQNEAPRYELICALTEGTPMPSEDVAAMTKYLESYLDKNLANPTSTTKPTCIPVEAGGVGQYVCQCSLASQTGEFPTTKKTMQTTVKGNPTQTIDVCDYSTWPQTTASATITEPPFPVPSDEKVVYNAMTCNDPKSAGYYGVQDVANFAQALYRDVFSSGLYAKPTGTTVDYSPNWDGFKVLKTQVRPYVDPAIENSMEHRWLALSIQYLKSACGPGEENKLIGFRNPDELNIEDFYQAFVVHADDCSDRPNDEVGLEQWTPGGTLNWHCIQWKLHSLNTMPSDSGNKHLQHWLNGTGSWNGTSLGRSWNETSKARWSGKGVEPLWTASAIGVGHKA